MNTGKVKWFDSKKGYGFIEQTGGGADCFVHYSAIEGSGYRMLHEGDFVQFETVNDPRKGLRAEKVKVLTAAQDPREPALQRRHD